MKLEVRNGEFKYKFGRTLYKNLSFSVEDGEILTILGPNGVGKTTLLKCIMAIVTWKKGETLLDGKSTSQMEPTDIWKKVAYVPQSHGVVFSYTVLDMVLMGRAPYLGIFSTPGASDIAIAKKSMEVIGISHLADKLYSEISGGEMQMVLIARALTSEPEILVLDEPESHLDFRNQLLMLSILEMIAKEKGITCIVNTHYPDHALRIADKTLLLGKGKRAVFGTAQEVITEGNLKEYFEVDARIVSFNEKGMSLQTIVPLTL
ncbi:MAG: ABC transporter ATP-binding protein [Bacillota bacterium]|nr:ABC transporter ATP-binding protein [Bacillota bacterium]